MFSSIIRNHLLRDWCLWISYATIKTQTFQTSDVLYFVQVSHPKLQDGASWTPFNIIIFWPTSGSMYGRLRKSSSNSTCKIIALDSCSNCKCSKIFPCPESWSVFPGSFFSRQQPKSELYKSSRALAKVNNQVKKQAKFHSSCRFLLMGQEESDINETRNSSKHPLFKQFKFRLGIVHWDHLTTGSGIWSF